MRKSLQIYLQNIECQLEEGNLGSKYWSSEFQPYAYGLYYLALAS